MKFLSLLCLALSTFASAQSCLIVATPESLTGIASWARRQRKDLSYVAGNYPDGMAFRSFIKDKDVDKIRSKNGRVIILDSKYTREDLEKAKQDCQTQEAKK